MEIIHVLGQPFILQSHLSYPHMASSFIIMVHCKIEILKGINVMNKILQISFNSLAQKAVENTENDS
jgi:Na+-translocating ferredoxin:NAD+ oxidoreductase RnfC subunit